MHPSSSIRPLAFLLLFVSLAGCSDADHVAPVTGTVRFQQQPLAGAIVRFQPRRGGSPSTAVTDESGRYELRYSRELLGAEIGDHSVSISTYSAGNPDAEPPRAPVPERIPARYNAESELTAQVQAGNNQIDFQLDGTGPLPTGPAIGD